MKNILTVDLEDWYQTQDFNFDPCTWCNHEDRIVKNTHKILDLLSKHNVHATFFVIGHIAKKHPNLIKEISDRGHEIGSHGNLHKMVSQLSKEEFREDLLISKKILEDIVGKSVQYFRAPTWSISKHNLWALEILEEEGFICDSSIQPFVTPLSGFKGAPAFPFHPVVNQVQLNILEFPPSVFDFFGIKLPFAGGLYMRAYPYFLMSTALKILNKQEKHGMIYIHPWEFDPEQPKLNIPMHVKFTHYYNLNTTYDKLERLIKDFEFITLGDYLKVSTKHPSEVLN